MWKKFWDFLKHNWQYQLIASAIFWSPPVVIAILAIIISPWFWTLFGTLVTIWTIMPAIPIQIAMAIGIKMFWEKVIRRNKNK